MIAEVDPRRVERILRNLVVNAVEHGEGRPVEVRLAADEDAVAITVRDHGVGLQPGEEQLVFNRFWRADPSRARQTGGTGLGLSIALEDARLHGGWLEAWGEPGRGPQFRLTLPAGPVTLTLAAAAGAGRRRACPWRPPRWGNCWPSGRWRWALAIGLGPAAVPTSGRRPLRAARALAGLLCAARGCSAAGGGILTKYDVQVTAPAGRSAGRVQPGAATTDRTASGARPGDLRPQLLAAAAGQPSAYARVSSSSPGRTATGSLEKQGSEVAINEVRPTEKPVIMKNAGGLLTVRCRCSRSGCSGRRVLGPPVVTDMEYQSRCAVRRGGPGTRRTGGDYVTDRRACRCWTCCSCASTTRTRMVYFWVSDAHRLVADQRYRRWPC